MEEANLYDEVDVTLELIPSSVHVSTKLALPPLNIALTLLVIGAFFALMYSFLLEKQSKKSEIALPT